MAEHPPQLRRRGVALILVLVVLASTSILAMAMLSTAAVQAKIAPVPAERTERMYLAESGLNLALYYLQNPSASPVSLFHGPYGNVHYPGETGLSFPGVEGQVTISVTNTANGVFSVTSTATVDGLSETATAVISMTKQRRFDYGAQLTGGVSLGSKVTISGGLITTGSLTSSASLSGPIVATNGAAYGGTATPADAEQSYPVTMTEYLPYYFYQGKRYTAAKLPSLVVGGTLLDLDVVNNPCNVWYADQNTTFMLATYVPGTIATKNGKSISLLADLSVVSATNMPALVLDKDISFDSGNKTLTAAGLVYVGGVIRGNGSSTCNFNISGALVSGSSGWPVNTSGYKGSINIAYSGSRATVSAFADTIEPITSLNIQSWEISNGRPQ